MSIALLVGWSLAVLATMLAEVPVTAPYFGIRVVDAATGRGVPLIELRTVNDISFFTDSNGWVAFREPGLMDRDVYFAVSGPGYEHGKDGFGFRGVRLATKPGTSATVKITRTNIAERMTRVTGQGIYRDSALLGLAKPNEPNIEAGVMGQDSVQAVPYRGKLFWLWGDTNLPNYPLGNFQTTAATSPHDGKPDDGIRLTYFTDPARPEFVRKMVPFNEPGPIWLFGLLTVADDKKQDVLISHFTRRKNLAEELEHGLVKFDDNSGTFAKLSTLPSTEKWRFPRGNAVRIGEYYYFAFPFFHTRVKATLEDVRTPDRYEAFAFDPKSKAYAWQRDAAPTTQAEEAKLIAAKAMASDRARYRITDAVSGKPVQIHFSSIAWNEYRKRWVLIGVESGTKDSPSALGEVWYAEADEPTGPWGKAVKIASHPRYSFYNPRQHAFYAADGGRIIYFEGTYTTTFSGNPTPTPRYEYNQLLYRLDLSDERLKIAR